MTNFKIVVLFGLLTVVEPVKVYRSRELAFTKAIGKGIEKSVAIIGQRVNVIDIDSQQTQVISTVIKTLMHLKNNYNIQIARKKPYELSDKTIRITEPSIVTLSSKDALKAFQKKVLLINVFPKNSWFLMICANSAHEDIRKLAVSSIQRRKARKGMHVDRNEMTSILNYQYFMIEDENVIKLLTFVWYMPGQCHIPQLIEVNRFNPQKGDWIKNDFVIDKFSNFNGCCLVVGVWPQGFFMNYRVNSLQGISTEGLQIKIIEELSKTLNYTFYFNPLQHNGTRRYYLGTELIADMLPVMMCFNTFNTQQRGRGSITDPYMFTYMSMAVPPGEDFDCYEKLMLPFDSSVWMMIALTFLIGFAVVFAINFTSIVVKSFVFGINVTTPSLNLGMIFFGISLTNLPTRNFARFLTMSFIIYSLIIRTAWQGKMFEFMQKNVTKPQVGSIQDMNDKGYTFYMMEQYLNLFPEVDFVKRSNVANYSSEKFFKIGHEHIYNPSFKGGIQVNAYYKALFSKNSKGKFYDRIIRDPMYTEICGMEFPINHRLFDVFNQKLHQLFSSGMINHYVEYLNKFSNPKYYAHLFKSEPQVLTMEHLEAGFVIWLVSISTALFTFVFELLWQCYLSRIHRSRTLESSQVTRL